MLAIFKTGGKQYSARAGQILKVEKLEGSKGDKVSITDVLAISDQSTNSLGEPLLKDASIEAASGRVSGLTLTREFLLCLLINGSNIFCFNLIFSKQN